MSRHDHTHLTLDERKTIQTGITNGSTKAAIARTIGKDETTVAKEIRKHRKIKPRNIADNPVVCKHRTELLIQEKQTRDTMHPRMFSVCYGCM